MKKIILTLMSTLPIKSIAIAAESARLHLIGEEQQQLLQQSLRAARLSIMPKGSNKTTVNEALNRLSNVYETNDPDFLEQKLIENINLLKKHGILTVNEAEIMSSSPSPDFM